MPVQNQHSQLTDDQLLANYRGSGDNMWLGHLLQRYTALLLGVGMKYLKDKVTAEDAVQQVFLKTLTHLPKEEMQNFKGWLYILMRNQCLQMLRDKEYNTGDEILANIQGTDTNKEEIILKEHTLEQMDEAMNILAPEQKECLTAFYLQKLSYNQIMERTGYGFMQVKSYIQNGKRNLRMVLLQKLKEKGLQ